MADTTNYETPLKTYLWLCSKPGEIVICAMFKTKYVVVRNGRQKKIRSETADVTQENTEMLENEVIWFFVVVAEGTVLNKMQ